MNATPGYQLMPSWMAEIMEPLSAEIKALAERAWADSIAAAEKNLPGNVVGAAIGSMIGLGVQYGLQVIAKAIATHPDVRPDVISQRMAMEIHNSTVLTFGALAQDLIDSRTATKQ